MPNFPVTVNNANQKEEILSRYRRAEKVMCAAFSVNKNRKGRVAIASEIFSLADTSSNGGEKLRFLSYKLSVQVRNLA